MFILQGILMGLTSSQLLDIRLEMLSKEFLYIGPESVMPLASVLAAIIGVILIFWRFILGAVKKVFTLIVSIVKGKPMIHEQAPMDTADEIDDEQINL